MCLNSSLLGVVRLPFARKFNVASAFTTNDIAEFFDQFVMEARLNCTLPNDHCAPAEVLYSVAFGD
jgi:hypothetical protein